MCGRYTLDPTPKFYERFKIDNRLDSLDPRYNIAPGQSAPVITRQSPNQVKLMKWGLIPHWAKDPKIGYRMINARAETITEKPSYKKPFLTQRCLVPASGFYEWQKSKDDKTPYYIQNKNQTLFAMAGLYDIWRDERGKDVCAFTIITTKPSAAVKNIHDRMPVILPEAKESIWLDISSDLAILKSMFDPFNELTAYPVSKLVNSPSNDSPELIKPVL